MERHYCWFLHCFAVVLAGATFGLIIAGGLVTSNDAGLAVPDWPLSFGQLMPEMVGGVFYEHGHRMFAATVGFLTLLLALVASRRERRGWVRQVAWIALALVFVQGLLGGLTVLLQLPPAISVLHACLAQTFFCVVVFLAVVTSRSWMSAPSALGRIFVSGPVRTAAVMVLSLYVQLILGAILRHSGVVGGSKGMELVASALFAHIAGALVVTVVLLMGVLSITRLYPKGAIGNLSYLLFGLLLLQLSLGVGAYLVRLAIPTRITPLPFHVLVTTAHVGVGALLLAGSVLLTMKLVQLADADTGRSLSWKLAEERS